MNEEKTDSLAPVSNKKSSAGAILKEILIFGLIAVGVVLPFRIYIAEPYLVDGRSMDPTFATGDYLIVDKISYRVKSPERNSVVVLRYPSDPKNDPDRKLYEKIFYPGKSFIKRIVGLPGETVIIKDSVVTIINDENPKGFILDDSFVTHPSSGSYEKKLGLDEYYVLGDNRAESYDSRFWGPLEKKYILGKPIIRLFPIKKIGLFPGDNNK